VRFKMNIYLFEREWPGYEKDDGYVIAAKTAKEAKFMVCSFPEIYKRDGWTCKKISRYTGKRKSPFIILSSWTGA